MPEIKFYSREALPMEMHKVKIVQKLNLLPAKERLKKMEEAGFNTFMLHNGDIFMDMLTDSGVNAMSDNMQSAMLRADDAYAGSETFYRMRDKLEEIFGIKYLLPAHQVRSFWKQNSDLRLPPLKYLSLFYALTHENSPWTQSL